MRRTVIILLLSYIFMIHGADGIPGNALKFDGIDDYVNCGNDSSLNVTSQMTIEAWIKAYSWQDHPAKGIIAYKFNTYSGFLLSCGDNGTLNFTIGLTDTWRILYSNPVMVLDKWYHAAGVYDGANVKLYLNGELVNETGISRAIGTNDLELLFGRHPTQTDRLFDGEIEEVRYWNTARTEQEIRENMNLTLTGSELGLISYWQFNEGTGSSTADAVSVNNGTLMNMDESCWTDSGIPIGSGSAATNIINTTGTVDFTGTDFTLDVTNVTDSCSVTVSRLNIAPNTDPPNSNNVFDSQYWVIRKYGSGSFESNTCFTVNEDLTVEDELHPEYISLYGREAYSVPAWELLSVADSVSASTNTSFHFTTDIEGQYILSRSAVYITTLNPADDQTEVVPDTDLEIVFSGKVITGSGNIEIRRYPDDSLFESVSVSEVLIDDSLVTVDPVNILDFNTEYYVLIDSTALMTSDSLEFSGIADKETWSFTTQNYFTEINSGIQGASYGNTEWGDYDNDGDLDIIITGRDQSTTRVAEIYRNDSGTFTDMNAGLSGIMGAVRWGDYDKDGDLDILLTGYNSSAQMVTRLYRNDSGSFVFIDAGIRGFYYESSADWGDYDNDGDLDILICGYAGSSQSFSEIYRNDGGSFILTGSGLNEAGYGCVDWGDYDSDGDLDIAISGMNNNSNEMTKIYRNDSGIFTDIGASLPDVYASTLSWGDYDNDGDLDLILSGSGTVSEIYRNDNGIFTGINAGITPLMYPSADWGDYDNDGDLDLIITGTTSSYQLVTELYENTGGIFNNTGIQFPGTDGGSVAWGDYDNDGDLDLILSGQTASGYQTKLYRNNTLGINNLPTVPDGLVTEFDGNNYRLSYVRSSDNETASDGLNYNLEVLINGQTITPAMADSISGYRRLPDRGNAQNNDFYIIKPASEEILLPQEESQKNIRWRVQAIDNSYAGSGFSEYAESVFDSRDYDFIMLDIMYPDDELKWEYVFSDSLIGYTLQADSDSNFAYPFEESITLSKSESGSKDTITYYSVALNGLSFIDSLENNVRYYWRVKPEYIYRIGRFNSEPSSFIFDPQYYPPSSISIEVSGNFAIISWGSKEDAKGEICNVYSTDDPCAEFPSGWFLEATVSNTTQWITQISGLKKFYCVTASSVVKSENPEK